MSYQYPKVSTQDLLAQYPSLKVISVNGVDYVDLQGALAIVNFTSFALWQQTVMLNPELLPAGMRVYLIQGNSKRGYTLEGHLDFTDQTERRKRWIRLTDVVRWVRNNGQYSDTINTKVAYLLGPKDRYGRSQWMMKVGGYYVDVTDIEFDPSGPGRCRYKITYVSEFDTEMTVHRGAGNHMIRKYNID